MSDRPVKITKTDARKFEQAIRKYAKILIPEFRIDFDHVELKSNFAEVSVDFVNCIAHVNLTTVTGAKLDFEKVALHEVLHVVLNKLAVKLEGIYDIDFINALEHDAIGRIVQLFFNKEGGSGKVR